jgi:hypothetical protein
VAVIGGCKLLMLLSLPLTCRGLTTTVPIVKVIPPDDERRRESGCDGGRPSILRAVRGWNTVGLTNLRGRGVGRLCEPSDGRNGEAIAKIR